MVINLEIFKAYDIRGVYPEEINEEIVYKIAQAYTKFLNFPTKVALGRDVRLSSPKLWEAAANGLVDAGVDVIDIGCGSTDMYYFAVANYGLDGGLMITASHNTREYNGMKMVREKAIPISGDTGINDIKGLVLSDFSHKADNKGTIEKIDLFDGYIKKMASFIDSKKIKSFKIVANANFGMAGNVINSLKKSIPMEIVELNFKPDGNFPKGKPDPLISENRKEMELRVVQESADFGVTWDADADRCFFVDSNGRFIEGSYISSILAKIMLDKKNGGKIISDPRIRRPIQAVANENNGDLIFCKSGHSFIKEKMRQVDAVYAGENSGHYFFKDYFYCDNGMIPFLLMLEYLSANPNTNLSQLNDHYKSRFPVSGEINVSVTQSVQEIIDKLKEKYQDGKEDDIDGLSIEYPDWRFNVRSSNTEPVIRINIEADSNELLGQKKQELLSTI